MNRVTRDPYLTLTDRGEKGTRRVTTSGISLRPSSAIIASACDRASCACTRSIPHVRIRARIRRAARTSQSAAIGIAATASPAARAFSTSGDPGDPMRNGSCPRSLSPSARSRTCRCPPLQLAPESRCSTRRRFTPRSVDSRKPGRVLYPMARENRSSPPDATARPSPTSRRNRTRGPR